MKLLTGMLLLLLLTPVMAEVYQWRDEHGRLQFSDSPPAQQSGKDTLRVETIKLEPITEIQSVKPKVSLTPAGRWREKEAAAKSRKKNRRLEREREARRSAANKRRCKNARSKYRSHQMKPVAAGSLSSLRKKHARRERLKQKMKAYCH
ncbi:MAG: DUF4124 domain-containing protein [Saccharospirillaceae bacterium]|nr:DUF4124 domain-containing protein [Saccharospirillaceae bacterium]